LKHYNARDALINSTISVIANEGLDKTTTKAIVRSTNISEAYIYRFFKDKEDLLSNTFSKLDDELVSKLANALTIMDKKDLPFEMRCWYCYRDVWHFLLGNREKTLAFIRYYYSPYFKKYSYAEHQLRYQGIISRFAAVFRSEANVWMILNHVLSVMLDFAVKVFNGDVEDNDDTTEHVFRLIYRAVSQYFDETKGQRGA